ncbi:MAG: imidazole glycerol phosphate synthase subunit HisH [Polyangiaceae bacterium]|nr:imidazole glycerol phosphate synthase subunit HisH [Polyangiaceae bacterium]
MKIALLDLGFGNLHSLAKAFSSIAPDTEVTIAPRVSDASHADLWVLPGVGGWSAVSLEQHRETLRAALERGQPCIGICLGMQLLFDDSEEGAGKGIGFFEGSVTRLSSARRPHMGWSRVAGTERAGSLAVPHAAYFAHSFACRPRDEATVVATTTIEGDTFACVAEKKRTIGIQFHPEKSSTEGIAFLASAVRRVTA